MTAPSDLSPALRLIEAVVDPGSLRSWDEPVEIAYEDGRYREDLARARERTGLDESVITGEGRVRGRRVAVVACEFRFLAGSIGVAAGERLVRAVERATAERLPLLAAPASGGTRMQEGTVAFVQMVKVTAAIADHKAAGLPYLVYLRHPTTGGVLASWGSLGHLTAAEPGALIGFLGPRVHRALYGEEFPAGVQTAENLLTNGLVDAVLPAGELPGVVARALDVLSDGGARVAPPGRAVTGSGDPAGASVTTDGGTDGGGNGGTDGGGAGGTDGGRAGGTGRGSGAGVRADAVVPAADGAGADAGTDISADLGPDDGAGAGTHAGTGTGPAGGERAPGPGAGPAKAPEAPASPSEAPASPSGTPARQSETPAPPPGTGPRGTGPGGTGPGGAEQSGPTVPGPAVPDPAVPEPAARRSSAPAHGTAERSAAADSIRRSRRPERPGVRALLRVAGRQVTPLSGTGAGEHDPGLLLALARIGGSPCVVLGHDRRADAAPPLGPGGLREARRGMRIAAELNLPLLTVVDTAGAALSKEAEEGGLAGEIARCLADLVTLPAPTLCLLLGQGAGGGALALLPADRVLAARHAWLSPLPPEGASAILHRTTERAYEVADRQGVRSADLLAHGIVDRVIDEPGPAETTAAPANGTAAPANGTAAPVNGTGRPAERGDGRAEGRGDRRGAADGERPQRPEAPEAPEVPEGSEGAQVPEGAAPVNAPDAADEPHRFLTHLGQVLGEELALLRAERPAARLAARRLRHRTLGARPAG